MKKLTAILLVLILALGLVCCGDAQEESVLSFPAEDEVLGATVLYAKQYYAFRVKAYSKTSTYSKSETVYEEGSALAGLLAEAELTPIEEDLPISWGYRVQFYGKGSEALGEPMLITLDGLLHRGDTLYRITDPEPILSLLGDAVKPTNLDAVSSL